MNKICYNSLFIIFFAFTYSLYSLYSQNMTLFQSPLHSVKVKFLKLVSPNLNFICNNVHFVHILQWSVLTRGLLYKGSVHHDFHGSDVNAEIIVREEVCSSCSPKRSSYYVCFWCLRLPVLRMTIFRMKGGSVRRIYPYLFLVRTKYLMIRDIR